MYMTRIDFMSGHFASINTEDPPYVILDVNGAGRGDSCTMTKTETLALLHMLKAAAEGLPEED